MVESSSAMAAKGVVLAVLLLQCCNVVFAARLLEGDGAWLQGGGARAGAGALIMQMLRGTTPGTANGCTGNPKHPPSGKCHN